MFYGNHNKLWKLAKNWYFGIKIMGVGVKMCLNVQQYLKLVFQNLCICKA